MSDNVLPFPRAPRADEADADLLLACGGGDRWALDELLRRHGNRVRRIVLRLRYVPAEDLDDVVQSTFLEVYRSAKSYNGRAPVGGWIVGIAMNVVRHYVRGEKRRRSALSILARSPVEVRQVIPDERVATRQLFARLELGFESLPPELRIVFTLCDLEQMRSIDVARALRIPEGTVWRRLHNARMKLRQALAGEVWR